MTLQDQDTPFFSGKMLACPLRGHWVSLRLVDELGSGKPYGGLGYQLLDSEGQKYNGVLDAEGFARLENCYRGAVILTFNEIYVEGESLYSDLITRKVYPLPITSFQVRAEETRFANPDGSRVQHNPAQKDADEFYQVEVRDLVEKGAHLPPLVKRSRPPKLAYLKGLSAEGIGLEELEHWGVILMPNVHTVLEVRPLRALRPMLSTDNEFCALNLYQLALAATLTYVGFGQHPSERPLDRVHFPEVPSPGNFFGEALASYNEVWRVNPDQTGAYYPLYENVPYSKRFEVLPFDPTLYEQNLQIREDEQEHPAKLHFFDDTEVKGGTDTQAYICHHDEIILIAVRGTQELVDWSRDADGLQVPFEEGKGNVHRGFYGAYLAIKKFIQVYLDQFYSGQKVIICGHSLGGAIALILAEALRRSGIDYDILLYTYGAPRAGDTTFVEAASKLVHHRIVNHNDPVPSVPAPWMNPNKGKMLTALLSPYKGSALWRFPLAIIRTDGDPYQHHGKQQHFMPVTFKEEQSSILWDPSCESIQDAAICSLAQTQSNQHYDGGDMPARDGFIQQLLDNADHKMVVSYIPFTWATLRRWQQAQKANQKKVTDREYRFIAKAIKRLAAELQEEERRTYNFPSGMRTMAAIARLREELNRLNTTFGRLKTLHSTKIETVDVYGNATQSPEFAASVERWMAHRENNVKELLAMIPSRPDDVYVNGAYQEVDADYDV